MAEEVVAHHAGQGLRVRGQQVRILHPIGVLGDLILRQRGIRVGHLHPLVDEGGIYLADQFAQPHEDVVELLGAVAFRNRVLQRAVSVRQVTQHHALGAAQPVGGHEVGESHGLFHHVAHDGFRADLKVPSPGVSFAEGVVGLV